MSLDTSLGNALKRLRMKTPQGSVEWIQNTNQDGQYSDFDDTGTYTDDYDDQVFATLNRGVREKRYPYSSRAFAKIHSRYR